MTSALTAAIYLPVAHLGHWYFFPIYLAPVLIVLWSAISTTLHERRRTRGERADEEER